MIFRSNQVYHYNLTLMIYFINKFSKMHPSTHARTPGKPLYRGGTGPPKNVGFALAQGIDDLELFLMDILNII